MSFNTSIIDEYIHPIKFENSDMRIDWDFFSEDVKCPELIPFLKANYSSINLNRPHGLYKDITESDIFASLLAWRYQNKVVFNHYARLEHVSVNLINRFYPGCVIHDYFKEVKHFNSDGTVHSYRLRVYDALQKREGITDLLNEIRKDPIFTKKFLELSDAMGKAENLKEEIANLKFDIQIYPQFKIPEEENSFAREWDRVWAKFFNTNYFVLQSINFLESNYEYNTQSPKKNQMLPSALTGVSLYTKLFFNY